VLFTEASKKGVSPDQLWSLNTLFMERWREEKAEGGEG